MTERNIFVREFSISREDREHLNGHAAIVIWMTGLSGAGKSTLADALERELVARGRHSYVLDGDNIRRGLSADLDFSETGRVENIRRVAEVAKLMMDAGLVVITSLISPFRSDREMARELIGPDRFVEVYVSTPLNICEERDPKGLYKRARAGQISQMTGLSSPYEEPLCPNYTVDASESDPTAAAIALLHHIDGLRTENAKNPTIPA